MKLLPFDGVLPALFIVAAFGVWLLTKRSEFLRTFERNHLWIIGLVDFVILPAAAYGAGLLAVELLTALDLPEGREAAREAAELLIYMAVAVGCARVIEIWVLDREGDATRTRLSNLARYSIVAVCVIVALFSFLSVNDYAPTELYVSTGALAALLAFAMQQTLGDLVSGLSLSVERPFRIGDWLRLADGTEGEVTDINWRATRLRKWDNTTFVAPNSQLARESFTNLHGPIHRFSPWYHVRVAGEADPSEVKALLEAAARRCASVLGTPSPVARLIDGETVPYTYMVWVHFRNYPAMFAGREELYREVRASLLEAGIGLAAEIQEVRLNASDGRVSGWRADAGPGRGEA